MLITLTWGWKYGLLSALVGGCQSMWWLWGPSNGYAIFLVVPPFTLWIAWHGLFAGVRKRQKDHKWWLSIYAVEVPFRILSTINLYTLSRWAITLNPTPWSWASGAPNTIPMPFSNFVVIKQAVVGYVILLLADVLLNLGFVRKFFGLEEEYDQANTSYIISASLLIGGLFWVVDSVVGSLIFHAESSFLDLLALNVSPYEAYARTFFILVCLAGGLLASNLLRRQRESDKALQESEKRLAQIVGGSSTPILVIDKKHTITHWNKACENLTGVPASDMIGTQKQWSPFYSVERPVMTDLIVDEVAEEDVARYYGGKYQKSALIEGAYEAEDFFPNFGGKWLFFTTAPLRDHQGKVVGAIETVKDITERKQAEEALQQYTQQLETLQVVTGALSTSLALDEVLELILEQLAAVVDYDSAAVFLVEGERLRCVVGRGHPHPEQVLGQLFPAGNELSQGMLTMGQPITLADAQADPRFQCWGDADHVRGWLGVPLQVRGEMIGHLTVDSRQLDAYGPAQVALVQPFGDQAAQAIENARLHEQVQRHAAELEQRVAERTAELQESEERSRAQYKGIPVPTYTWQKVGEDLVLVDYNDAALEITQGGVANFVGTKATEMYRDRPEIQEEIWQCFAEKTTIEREMPYHYTITGGSKHLAVKYAFVPPDLVLVHTEDITPRVRAQEEIEKRTAELRKMVNLMAGREVRMAGLKGVIRQLRAQLEDAGLMPVADDPLLAGRID